MKRLLLVRHAKSDWSDAGLRDFDRPLNARGEHDAPRMARFLRERELVPTFLLASPAARTYATARHFAAAFGIAENDIALMESLYDSSADDLLGAVVGLPDLHDVVAVFGHNPAMTTAVSRFADEYVSNVPTCGVACVTSEAESWAGVRPGAASLRGLWTPKGVLAAYE